MFCCFACDSQVNWQTCRWCVIRLKAGFSVFVCLLTKKKRRFFLFEATMNEVRRIALTRRVVFGAMVVSGVAVAYIPHELERRRVTGFYLHQLPFWKFRDRCDRCQSHVCAPFCV